MASWPRSALIALAALAAAALAFAFLWIGDREYARDLLRALFGLSGGTTAGG
jgi:ABC-type Na+ efflux pump permease subunit